MNLCYLESSLNSSREPKLSQATENSPVCVYWLSEVHTLLRLHRKMRRTSLQGLLCLRSKNVNYTVQRIFALDVLYRYIKIEQCH